MAVNRLLKQWTNVLLYSARGNRAFFFAFYIFSWEFGLYRKEFLYFEHFCRLISCVWIQFEKMFALVCSLEKPKQKNLEKFSKFSLKNKIFRSKRFPKRHTRLLLHVQISSSFTNIFLPLYLVMLFQEYQNLFSPNLHESSFARCGQITRQKTLRLIAKQEQGTI